MKVLNKKEEVRSYSSVSADCTLYVLPMLLYFCVMSTNRPQTTCT